MAESKAKARGRAPDATKGTVSIRRDHAWEFCCGTQWTSTCLVLGEGEGMAVFHHRTPFDPLGNQIRCNTCGEMLPGLQRIRAAEHMAADVIGVPGFRIWPLTPGAAWAELDAARADLAKREADANGAGNGSPT